MISVAYNSTKGQGAGLGGGTEKKKKDRKAQKSHVLSCALFLS